MLNAGQNRKEHVKFMFQGLKYHDDKVTEGHQYEYRVVAVNTAGSGKPSDPSKIITAKPMFGKNAFIFFLVTPFLGLQISFVFRSSTVPTRFTWSGNKG